MGDLTENFSRHEFRCPCGCGLDTVDYSLLVELQNFRTWIDMPVIILSGHRCLTHNKKVGGKRNSQHPKGRAADIFVPKTNVALVFNYFCGHVTDLKVDVIKGCGIGLYRHSNFVHFDTRTDGPARWIELPDKKSLRSVSVDYKGYT